MFMDNWTIVKLLGGLSVILTGITIFISNYLKKIMERSVDYKFEKKLEGFKGEIEKNNLFISSIIQNYFSSSQKILDKKIQAYEELWLSMIKIKSVIPSGINLTFQILTDEELNDTKAYSNLQNLSINLDYNADVEMKKLFDIEDNLMKFQPYISDKIYKLFFVYRSVIARVIHQFISTYKSKKVYNWKNDQGISNLLAIVLTEKETKYVYSLPFTSFPNLLDLLEYKFVQDFRTNLDVKDSTNDSIGYLKDLEKIFEISKSTT